MLLSQAVAKTRGLFWFLKLFTIIPKLNLFTINYLSDNIQNILQ